MSAQSIGMAPPLQSSYATAKPEPMQTDKPRRFSAQPRGARRPTFQALRPSTDTDRAERRSLLQRMCSQRDLHRLASSDGAEEGDFSLWLKTRELQPQPMETQAPRERRSYKREASVDADRFRLDCPTEKSLPGVPIEEALPARFSCTEDYAIRVNQLHHAHTRAGFALKGPKLACPVPIPPMLTPTDMPTETPPPTPMQRDSDITGRFCSLFSSSDT